MLSLFQLHPQVLRRSAGLAVDEFVQTPSTKAETQSKSTDVQPYPPPPTHGPVDPLSSQLPAPFPSAAPTHLPAAEPLCPSTMAAAGPRRRKTIGHRRRVEDEGEEEGGPEALDLDDDSLTDGSIVSDEHDQADDSDTSNVDEISPTSHNAQKSVGNGSAKPGFRRKPGGQTAEKSLFKQVEKAVTDNEIMLQGLSLTDKDDTAQELNFDDVQRGAAPREAAPIVVSSSPAPRQQGRVPIQELKRREHEEYRRKRDEDPTFVPNRGAFFLHDHRHPGPSSNGFRPFPRGARGRGRGAFAAPFLPVKYVAPDSYPPHLCFVLTRILATSTTFLTQPPLDLGRMICTKPSSSPRRNVNRSDTLPTRRAH